MFDIHPRIAYNLADQDFNRVLTLHQDFKRKDLMKEGNKPYSITYRIAYTLSNTHHSDLFLRKEYIEIPRIFKEFAKVITPDPIRIPRLGGVDIVIKDHPVLERTLSTRTEFSSRMFFSEDRITGYRGKEKELIKTFTPLEIRQPVIGRYEGMLEIAGHKILVTGIAGREHGSMTLGINFLEEHKPWGRKGADILLGNNFIQTFAKYVQDNNRNLLSFTTNCGSEIQDKRKFGKALLSFRQQGPIESDSFYEESEKEIINLKEALQEIKNKIEATLKVKEECKYEYVRYISIQMNMEDKKDMQMIIKEHINLGLIEPGVSNYSSPDFLIRNHGEIKRGILIDEIGIELQDHIVEKIHNFPDILKDKKQLQSFLGVVNFAGTSENLEELDRQFGRLAVNTQVAGQVQRADLDTVQTAIRSSLVASTTLWNDLREPIRKASPSGVANELKEHDPKHALRVQGSRPVVVDSSTACTRPSSDSGDTTTIESQGVQISDDSSQPNTSEVKEGEISLRPMTDTSKVNTNELISSSSAWQVYQRIWKKLVSRKVLIQAK
ncbi:UNVERIFIED_CONTAM: movement protein [Sesamum radiatum]|uniref:Movement protein n=1 Tax=Sesamum radiatum TaxID=300843 RepID=A0AAW2IQ83_SESRA